MIYPIVHNRYKADFVVCACSFWERKMRTVVIDLEGKQIKLSKNLMDKLESGWHFLYPLEVTIKVGNRPTRFALWRHKGKEGFISRIVFTRNPGWGSKVSGGVILCSTPQSNKETVVITSLD